MKGGTFLSKKGYDEMKTKIETDYESIISSGPYIEKSYAHIRDKDEREEYELQYKAIICMLSHTTKIDYIYVESIFGIIFYIKSSKSYFKKLDTDGNEVPVDDLLLKFSVITDSKIIYFLDVYDNDIQTRVYKLTETTDDVKKEAEVQQSVYISMLKTGFVICPSVLDITILRDSSQIDIFFNLFKSKTMDTRTSACITEIKDKVKKTSGELSIMTCEYLSESKTFYKIDDKENDIQTVYFICAYIISIILALYIYRGIIHKDLKASNIMIPKITTANMKNLKNRIYLIDYGLVDDRTSVISFNDRFKAFFGFSEEGLIIDFVEIQTWLYNETTFLASIYTLLSFYDSTPFKMFENVTFKDELTRYCNELFNTHHINVHRKGTRKTWKKGKFYKYLYEEKQTDVKTEKVLLNDFNDQVLSMIKGDVSIIGPTEGGKSNLTRKRSKKHHKKTQRRTR